MKALCAQCKKQYEDNQLDLIAIKERLFYACPDCVEQLNKG